MPFAHCAATATFRCLIFARATNSENLFDVDAVPRSETSSVGLPKSEKILVKVLIVPFDEVDFTGWTHVKRENESIATNILLRPGIDSTGT